MEPEPIGRTQCGRCRGTGKQDDEAPCAACGGTGLVPVFKQAPPADTAPTPRFSRYYTDLPIKVHEQERGLEGRCVEGRCVVIGEAGLAAILPDAVPAESAVTLRLPVPTHPTVLEARAVVRNQLGLRHGFEFVSLTEAEQESIRQFCKGLAIQWCGERDKS